MTARRLENRKMLKKRSSALMASTLSMAAVPAAANISFSKRVASASAISARPARAAARRSPLQVSAHSAGPAEEEEAAEDSSARAFRRTLGQSANYSRKHKKDAEAAKLMEEQGVGIVSKGGSPLGLFQVHSNAGPVD